MHRTNHAQYSSTNTTRPKALKKHPKKKENPVHVGEEEKKKQKKNRHTLNQPSKAPNTHIHGGTEPRRKTTKTNKISMNGHPKSLNRRKGPQPKTFSIDSLNNVTSHKEPKKKTPDHKQRNREHDRHSD
jgi:hypothetical protein